MTETNNRFPRLFDRVRSLALVGAAAGIALLIVLLLTDTNRFWQGYLFGYIFWLTLTLGCFALTLIQGVVRSSWGLAILRLVEAGARILPLMALLAIPLLIAVWTGKLYPWADPHYAETHHHAASKIRYYLNPPFFTVRLAVYFAIWLAISHFLVRWSVKEDETGDPALTQARVNLAAPGLVAFVLTVTFAMTDLVMSLDPMWFSTIWGIWWVVGIGLTATSFVLIVLSAVSGVEPFSDIATPGLFRDLGNLLLTFTMFWGYISLSQWLIIYSGNLPEETTFYLNRGLNPYEEGISYWWMMGTVLVVFQFFVPFLLLLSGRNKRTPAYLGKIAWGVFAVRILDMFWTIIPFFKTAQIGGVIYKPNMTTLGLSVAAWLAIGGVWLFLWASNLRKAPLLARHFSRAPGVVEHA